MHFSIWQLLVILVIVVLLFGTKRLRTLGTDLGSAIKSFRTAVKEGEEKDDNSELDLKKGQVIEGEVNKEKNKV